MNHLPAALALVVVLVACSDPGSAPREAPTPVATQRPTALSLVPFDTRGSGEGETTLRGCAGVSDEEDAGYTLPILIWARLRVAARLTLLPATYAERSSSIDSATQYVGPDPGPEAPHLAISIGPAGGGPTDTRDGLRYDTYLIGDRRDSPAGLAGAKASWAARAPLRTRGVTLARGDHYLFVEVDPAKGGMDLHGLTANWRASGALEHLEIGTTLSIRQQCGG